MSTKAALVFILLSACASESSAPAGIDDPGSSDAGVSENFAVAPDKAPTTLRPDLSLSEQALKPNQDGWLRFEGPYPSNHVDTIAWDTCALSPSEIWRVKLYDDGQISYGTYATSTGNEYMLDDNANPYVADIICDDFNRLWVFNKDRSLWSVNQQLGGTPTYTWVGSPTGARQIEFARGMLWALNDDETIWKSPNGADGTWTLVGKQPGARLLGGTPGKGATPKLLLWKQNGDILMGDGSNEGWKKFGYSAIGDDIFGGFDDGEVSVVILEATPGNREDNYWEGNQFDDWSDVSNPPAFAPPPSPPRDNAYRWFNYACYCGGYHQMTQAYVEPRYVEAQACAASDGDIGFTIGATCDSVCNQLFINNVGGVPYIAPWSQPTDSSCMPTFGNAGNNCADGFDSMLCTCEGTCSQSGV
jgi:hypothetical protein